MKVRIPVTVLTVMAALGVTLTFAADASLGPISLAEKVAKADAIVVGKVAEIETKRFALTYFERNSDGKVPKMTTFYNLAVMHPETVIKADTDSMVNKADKSNPVAWMHIAYQAPGTGLERDYPGAKEGEYRIWFLRRDMVLTGHYFIREVEAVTEARIEEIKRLVAEGHKEKGKDNDK